MPDESQDEWSVLWKQRVDGLEQLLGKADDRVYHALIPLQLGGSCDVLCFRGHVAGLAYVTSDLTGIGQPPNSTGTYELMICTRDESDWAADIISRLGAYTLENVITPGDTMDIGAAVPEGAIIAAFLFAEPDVAGNAFPVGNETAKSALVHRNHASRIEGMPQRRA